MRVLTIDNKYNDGDVSHFFIERNGAWSAMFKPELTLRQFLVDLLEVIDWDAEPCQFDLPEGGAVALVLAAESSDAPHFFNMLARWDQKGGMLTSFGDWEVGYEMLDAHYLDPRELGTVLAALRVYQDKVASSVSDALEDISTDGGTQEPLSYDEIDDLCDKLN